MPRQLGVMTAVAVSYFYYHYQFFTFLEKTMERKEKRRIAIIFTFGINYAWFVAASFLNLHLIINWTIFFFFFLAEIYMIYRAGADKSAALAYFGIIPGLAWNICFRCIFALILNRPLTAFDNQLDLPGNLKRYPIFLGFAVTGLLFHYFSRKHFYKRIRAVLNDRSSLRFNIGIQFVLYVYLALNLLGYYVPENSFFLKFWGIKSAIFALVGLIICNIYTMRMSRLNLYRKKMREDRITMLADKKEEERLWMLAYVDALTGCYNRHLAEQIMERYFEQHEESCLCFVDLDQLKLVNDKFGHPEGDQYLKTAASYLKTAAEDANDYVFRYGGDEFLLLFSKKTRVQVTALMHEIQEKLKQHSVSCGLPFSMFISFGMAQIGEAETTEKLLELADRRMYDQKRRKAGERNEIKRDCV